MMFLFGQKIVGLDIGIAPTPAQMYKGIKDKGDIEDDGFEFILMRHAESVNNMRQHDAPFPGVFTRVPDPVLTDKGKQQAEVAAEMLARIEGMNSHLATLEIFTSDMNRTIETAMFVAKGLRRGMPATRVCVVPLPFFNEMGSDTVVSEPYWGRFSDIERECGAVLDGSLWRSSWGESREFAGNYEVCISRFLLIVLPWLEERCRRQSKLGKTKSGPPIIVGHGQYMRHMLNVWKRFHNTEAVYCRFRRGVVEIIDCVRRER